MLNLKSIIKLILLFITFNSCNKTGDNYTLLTRRKWFDRFGNVYLFENDTIKSSIKAADNFWALSTFSLEKDLLTINCIDDSIKKSIQIIDLNEESIVLNSGVDYCEVLSRPLWKDTFEMFARKPIDNSEYLIFMNFEAFPSFLYTDPRKFNLTNKSITYKTGETTLIRQKVNDNIYNEIHNLIKTLPLEKYESQYYYPIIDGCDYEIFIKTNKIEKRIKCQGQLPIGLNNLIATINHYYK